MEMAPREANIALNHNVKSLVRSVVVDLHECCVNIVFQ